MNKSLRSFLILISCTVVAILIIVVLLWLSLSEREDTNDESFFDSFVSAHTDEDIVNYVTKEHDLDVDVIDNQGSKQLKTGRGGLARVETNDGMEFEVFINTFGAITGNNYEYLLAVPNIKSNIEDSKEIDEIKASGIDDVTLLTDAERKKLDVLLKNPGSLHTVDDQFLDQIFMAYNIIEQWNATIQSEHDLMIDTLQISYEQDGKESKPSRLFVYMDEDIRAIEELEQHLTQTNNRRLTEAFLEDDMKQLDRIHDQLPEMFDFVADKVDGFEMECTHFASFDTCDSYKLIVGLHDDLGYDEFKLFRYDNEQVIDDLFEITQLIQTLDLPQIKLIVEKIYVPDDLDKQSYSEKQLIDKDPDEQFSRHMVEVINAQEMTSKDQIEFQYDE